MTDEDVRRRVTSGTTTRPEQVRVLYNDSVIALVKHRGAMVGREPFPSWEPSWVDQYNTINPRVALGCWLGEKVWCCGKGEDGVLTPKRLRALVVKLGLRPEFIR